MNHQPGFDTDRYLDLQSAAMTAFMGKGSGRLHVEFGGKLIQDRHCARVLPGYREDAKLELVRRLCHNGEPIFVVSAKDIMRGRVRGDFGTPYDQETLRVLTELESRGLAVKKVAISLLVQGQPIPQPILQLEDALRARGITPYRFWELKPYTASQELFSQLDLNPYIPLASSISIIIGPGGGSGKFGICLNQLYHEMKAGTVPRYMKFETFPIHDLPLLHPLNLAFMAASADFFDVVMEDIRHGKATSYKRDLDNYELLNCLANAFQKEGEHLRALTSATTMGVNLISQGIVDDEEVQKEAAAEISRRLVRYQFEVAAGKEKPEVVDRVRTILRML